MTMMRRRQDPGRGEMSEVVAGASFRPGALRADHANPEAETAIVKTGGGAPEGMDGGSRMPRSTLPAATGRQSRCPAASGANLTFETRLPRVGCER